jgi:hypothetical protein
MVLAGRALARARRHLLARAGAVQRDGAGDAVTLLAHGVALAPVRRAGDRLLFLVPAETGCVTLLTGDGAALAGVVLDGRLLDPEGDWYGAGFAPPVRQGRRILRGIAGSASLVLPRGDKAGRSLELIIAALDGLVAAEY